MNSNFSWKLSSLGRNAPFSIGGQMGFEPPPIRQSCQQGRDDLYTILCSGHMTPREGECSQAYSQEQTQVGVPPERVIGKRGVGIFLCYFYHFWEEGNSATPKYVSLHTRHISFQPIMPKYMILKNKIINEKST